MTSDRDRLGAGRALRANAECVAADVSMNEQIYKFVRWKGTHWSAEPQL